MRKERYEIILESIDNKMDLLLEKFNDLKKENDDRRNQRNKDFDLLIAADNVKTLNMSKRIKQLVS